MRRFSILHILICLCILPATGWADVKVHNWADYTKPFDSQLKWIDVTNLGIVEVDLPESTFIEKKVVLVFSSRGSSNSGGGVGAGLVLSVNGVELPMLPVKRNTTVMLEQKLLKPGTNRLSFSGVGKWGVDIYDLRIELREPVAQIPKKSDQDHEEQVYKWEDYTKPFKTIVPAGTEKPGIVLVELPEFLTKHDDIGLRVSAAGTPSVRFSIVVNETERLFIPVGPGAKILLPKGVLKAGKNILKFNFEVLGGSFSTSNRTKNINEISFDLPPEITQAQTIPSSKAESTATKNSSPPAGKSGKETGPVKSEQVKAQPSARTELKLIPQAENSGGAPKTSDSPPSMPKQVEATPYTKQESTEVALPPASVKMAAPKGEEVPLDAKQASDGPHINLMPSTSPTDMGQRWAVVIGVSEYEDTRIPGLRYAARDAKSVHDWLVSPNGGRFSPSRVRLLTDRNATNDNIKDSLFMWLKQAIEEDLVLIYFAGHGSPESPDAFRNLYLLPYNAKYNSIAVSGFPMWDIETALKRFIKAKRVVIIADACHSAGVGQTFDMATRAGRGIKVNSINSGFQELIGLSEGICVISASRDNELSREGKEWGGGHGVFSHYLLEGLKGAADFDKNGMVTIGELTVYVSQEVRRATLNAQNPIVSGRFDPALTIAK